MRYDRQIILPEVGEEGQKKLQEAKVLIVGMVDTAVELVKNDDYGTPVPNYTDENVSTKVVKIIQSYVGVVNKMVWRKEI